MVVIATFVIIAVLVIVYVWNVIISSIKLTCCMYDSVWILCLLDSVKYLGARISTFTSACTIEFCHFPVKSVSKVCCSVFVCVV